jgi:hypothetical protein
MAARLTRHVATLTLVFFTVWSWTDALALVRAQRAATGLAIAGIFLLVAALLPKRPQARYGDDYSWALAVAVIIAGGAAVGLTQPTAVAVGGALTPPTAGRLFGAMLLGAGFGLGSLLIAVVTFFMTAWPGSARDYRRLVFGVLVPFLVVGALSITLAIHASFAATALRR